MVHPYNVDAATIFHLLLTSCVEPELGLVKLDVNLIDRCCDLLEAEDRDKVFVKVAFLVDEVNRARSEQLGKELKKEKASHEIEELKKKMRGHNAD